MSDTDGTQQGDKVKVIGEITSVTGTVLIISDNGKGTARVAKVGDKILATDVIDDSNGSYKMIAVTEQVEFLQNQDLAVDQQPTAEVPAAQQIEKELTPEELAEQEKAKLEKEKKIAEEPELEESELAKALKEVQDLETAAGQSVVGDGGGAFLNVRGGILHITAIESGVLGTDGRPIGTDAFGSISLSQADHLNLQNLRSGGSNLGLVDFSSAGAGAALELAKGGGLADLLAAFGLLGANAQLSSLEALLRSLASASGAEAARLAAELARQAAEAAAAEAARLAAEQARLAAEEAARRAEEQARFTAEEAARLAALAAEEAARQAELAASAAAEAARLAAIRSELVENKLNFDITSISTKQYDILKGLKYAVEVNANEAISNLTSAAGVQTLQITLPQAASLFLVPRAGFLPASDYIKTLNADGTATYTITEATLNQFNATALAELAKINQIFDPLLAGKLILSALKLDLAKVSQINVLQILIDAAQQELENKIIDPATSANVQQVYTDTYKQLIELRAEFAIQNETLAARVAAKLEQLIADTQKTIDELVSSKNAIQAAAVNNTLVFYTETDQDVTYVIQVPELNYTTTGSVTIDAVTDGIQFDANNLPVGKADVRVEHIIDFGGAGAPNLANDKVRLVLDLDLKFIDPSFTEQHVITLKLPAVIAGLNWDTNLLPAGWQLVAGNLVRDSVGGQTTLSEQIILEIDRGSFNAINVERLDFTINFVSTETIIGGLDLDIALNNQITKNLALSADTLLGDGFTKELGSADSAKYAAANAVEQLFAERQVTPLSVVAPLLELKSRVDFIKSTYANRPLAELESGLNNLFNDSNIKVNLSDPQARVITQTASAVFVNGASAGEKILTGTALKKFFEAWQADTTKVNVYVGQGIEHYSRDFKVSITAKVKNVSFIVANDQQIVVDAIAEGIVEAGPVVAYLADKLQVGPEFTKPVIKIDFTPVDTDASESFVVELVIQDPQIANSPLTYLNLDLQVLGWSDPRLKNVVWQISRDEINHKTILTSELSKEFIGSLNGQIFSDKVQLSFKTALLQQLNNVQPVPIDSISADVSVYSKESVASGDSEFYTLDNISAKATSQVTIFSLPVAEKFIHEVQHVDTELVATEAVYLDYKGLVTAQLAANPQYVLDSLFVKLSINSADNITPDINLNKIRVIWLDLANNVHTVPAVLQFDGSNNVTLSGAELAAWQVAGQPQLAVVTDRYLAGTYNIEAARAIFNDTILNNQVMASLHAQPLVVNVDALASAMQPAGVTLSNLDLFATGSSSYLKFDVKGNFADIDSSEQHSIQILLPEGFDGKVLDMNWGLYRVNREEIRIGVSQLVFTKVNIGENLLLAGTATGPKATLSADGKTIIINNIADSIDSTIVIGFDSKVFTQVTKIDPHFVVTAHSSEIAANILPSDDLSDNAKQVFWQDIQLSTPLVGPGGIVPYLILNELQERPLSLANLTNVAALQQLSSASYGQVGKLDLSNYFDFVKLSGAINTSSRVEVVLSGPGAAGVKIFTASGEEVQFANGKYTVTSSQLAQYGTTTEQFLYIQPKIYAHEDFVVNAVGFHGNASATLITNANIVVNAIADGLDETKSNTFSANLTYATVPELIISGTGGLVAKNRLSRLGTLNINYDFNLADVADNSQKLSLVLDINNLLLNVTFAEKQAVIEQMTLDQVGGNWYFETNPNVAGNNVLGRYTGKVILELPNTEVITNPHLVGSLTISNVNLDKILGNISVNSAALPISLTVTTQEIDTLVGEANTNFALDNVKAVLINNIDIKPVTIEVAENQGVVAPASSFELNLHAAMLYIQGLISQNPELPNSAKFANAAINLVIKGADNAILLSKYGVPQLNTSATSTGYEITISGNNLQKLYNAWDSLQRSAAAIGQTAANFPVQLSTKAYDNFDFVIGIEAQHSSNDPNKHVENFKYIKVTPVASTTADVDFTAAFELKYIDDNDVGKGYQDKAFLNIKVTNLHIPDIVDNSEQYTLTLNLNTIANLTFNLPSGQGVRWTPIKDNNNNVTQLQFTASGADLLNLLNNRDFTDIQLTTNLSTLIKVLDTISVTQDPTTLSNALTMTVAIKDVDGNISDSSSKTLVADNFSFASTRNVKEFQGERYHLDLNPVLKSIYSSADQDLDGNLSIPEFNARFANKDLLLTIKIAAANGADILISGVGYKSVINNQIELNSQEIKSLFTAWQTAGGNATTSNNVGKATLGAIPLELRGDDITYSFSMSGQNAPKFTGASSSGTLQHLQQYFIQFTPILNEIEKLALAANANASVTDKINYAADVNMVLNFGTWANGLTFAMPVAGGSSTTVTVTNGTATLAGLGELMKQFLTVSAASADIPISMLIDKKAEITKITATISDLGQTANIIPAKIYSVQLMADFHEVDLNESLVKIDADIQQYLQNGNVFNEYFNIAKLKISLVGIEADTKLLVPVIGTKQVTSNGEIEFSADELKALYNNWKNINDDNSLGASNKSLALHNAATIDVSQKLYSSTAFGVQQIFTAANQIVHKGEQVLVTVDQVATSDSYAQYSAEIIHELVDANNPSIGFKDEVILQIKIKNLVLKDIDKSEKHEVSIKLGDQFSNVNFIIDKDVGWRKDGNSLKYQGSLTELSEQLLNNPDFNTINLKINVAPLRLAVGDAAQDLLDQISFQIDNTELVGQFEPITRITAATITNNNILYGGFTEINENQQGSLNTVTLDVGNALVAIDQQLNKYLSASAANNKAGFFASNSARIVLNVTGLTDGTEISIPGIKNPDLLFENGLLLSNAMNELRQIIEAAGYNITGAAGYFNQNITTKIIKLSGIADGTNISFPGVTESATSSALAKFVVKGGKIIIDSTHIAEIFTNWLASDAATDPSKAMQFTVDRALSGVAVSDGEVIIEGNNLLSMYNNWLASSSVGGLNKATSVPITITPQEHSDNDFITQVLAYVTTVSNNPIYKTGQSMVIVKPLPTGIDTQQSFIKVANEFDGSRVIDYGTNDKKVGELGHIRLNVHLVFPNANDDSNEILVKVPKDVFALGDQQFNLDFNSNEADSDWNFNQLQNGIIKYVGTPIIDSVTGEKTIDSDINLTFSTVQLANFVTSASNNVQDGNVISKTNVFPGQFKVEVTSQDSGISVPTQVVSSEPVNLAVYSINTLKNSGEAITFAVPETASYVLDLQEIFTKIQNEDGGVSAQSLLIKLPTNANEAVGDILLPSGNFVTIAGADNNKSININTSTLAKWFTTWKAFTGTEQEDAAKLTVTKQPPNPAWDAKDSAVTIQVQNRPLSANGSAKQSSFVSNFIELLPENLAREPVYASDASAASLDAMKNRAISYQLDQVFDQIYTVLVKNNGIIGLQSGSKFSGNIDADILNNILTAGIGGTEKSNLLFNFLSSPGVTLDKQDPRIMFFNKDHDKKGVFDTNYHALDNNIINAETLRELFSDWFVANGANPPKMYIIPEVGNDIDFKFSVILNIKDQTVDSERVSSIIIDNKIPVIVSGGAGGATDTFANIINTNPSVFSVTAGGYTTGVIVNPETPIKATFNVAVKLRVNEPIENNLPNKITKVTIKLPFLSIQDGQLKTNKDDWNIINDGSNLALVWVASGAVTAKTSIDEVITIETEVGTINHIADLSKTNDIYKQLSVQVTYSSTLQQDLFLGNNPTVFNTTAGFHLVGTDAFNPVLLQFGEFVNLSATLEDASAFSEGVYYQAPDGVAATLTGSAQQDILVGGSQNDILTGNAGNDYISGNAGNDIISGGPGDDTIYGGSGNDSIDGGDGNDLLHGGTGHDYIFGNLGDDIIHSGAIEEPNPTNWAFDWNGSNARTSGVNVATLLQGYTTQINQTVSAITATVANTKSVSQTINNTNLDYKVQYNVNLATQEINFKATAIRPEIDMQNSKILVVLGKDITRNVYDRVGIVAEHNWEALSEATFNHNGKFKVVNNGSIIQDAAFVDNTFVTFDIVNPSNNALNYGEITNDGVLHIKNSIITKNATTQPVTTDSGWNFISTTNTVLNDVTHNYSDDLWSTGFMSEQAIPKGKNVYFQIKVLRDDSIANIKLGVIDPTQINNIDKTNVSNSNAAEWHIPETGQNIFFTQRFIDGTLTSSWNGLNDSLGNKLDAIINDSSLHAGDVISVGLDVTGVLHSFVHDSAGKLKAWGASMLPNELANVAGFHFYINFNMFDGVNNFLQIPNTVLLDSNDFLKKGDADYVSFADLQNFRAGTITAEELLRRGGADNTDGLGNQFAATNDDYNKADDVNISKISSSYDIYAATPQYNAVLLLNEGNPFYESIRALDAPNISNNADRMIINYKISPAEPVVSSLSITGDKIVPHLGADHINTQPSGSIIDLENDLQRDTIHYEGLRNVNFQPTHYKPSVYDVIYDFEQQYDKIDLTKLFTASDGQKDHFTKAEIISRIQVFEARPEGTDPSVKYAALNIKGANGESIELAVLHGINATDITQSWLNDHIDYNPDG